MTRCDKNIRLRLYTVIQWWQSLDFFCPVAQPAVIPITIHNNLTLYFIQSSKINSGRAINLTYLVYTPKLFRHHQKSLWRSKKIEKIEKDWTVPIKRLTCLGKKRTAAVNPFAPSTASLSSTPPRHSDANDKLLPLKQLLRGWNPLPLVPTLSTPPWRGF